MPIPGTFQARRSFGYDGSNIDRGQLFEFKGLPNDEKLVRLGYAAKIAGVPRDTIECGFCFQKFMGFGERDAHVKLRHPKFERSLEEEEALVDRLEQTESKLAPLFMDKTQASRESGEGALELADESAGTIVKKATTKRSTKKTTKKRQ
jgi:hypothetical protein